MSKTYDPRSGQQQDFRPQQYPDDPGQNSKSTEGGDYSSYAPGFEGYDRMNPPSIQQLRGLSDTSGARGATPSPATSSTPSPISSGNLNQSTSGATDSVPAGTTRGAQLAGSAGSTLTQLGLKYAANKLGGLVTAKNNVNSNDLSVADAPSGVKFNGLNDAASGTQRGINGTQLAANDTGTMTDAGTEGVQVNALNDGAAGTARAPEGTPLNDGGAANANDAGAVAGAAAEGAPVDLAGNAIGNVDEFGNAIEGGGEALNGVDGGVPFIGSAINLAVNGINSESIGSAAGAAIGQALIPIPIVGGLIGGAIGKAVGGGSVICTELRSQKLLDRNLYADDCRYARDHLSPITVRGYHFWAIPYVRLMRRSPLATKLMRPIAVWRAQDIAWRLGHGERCLRGTLVRVIAEPICFAIGLFVEQSDYQKLYEGSTS